MKYIPFREAAALLILAAASYSDIRNKCIHTIPVLLTGAVGILVTFLSGDVGTERLVSFAPGAVFLGMSLLTKGGVGLGDGLVLLALGAWLEWDLLLSSLFCALLGSAAAAGYLLVVRHSGRNGDFPFIPFLLGGYLISALYLFH